MDPQLIIDRIDRLEESTNNRMDILDINTRDRIDRLETSIQTNQAMCQQLCITKLTHVEGVAEKAHERLDKHKESIIDLCADKNKAIGFRNSIYFIMTVLTIIIMVLGVIVALPGIEKLIGI